MLIGFTGKLGSGKDTAGKRLAEMYDGETTRIGFADLLKESAAALLGIPVADWEKYKNDPMIVVTLSNLENEDPITMHTAREFLQRYGTEAHRDVFSDDFWVEQALAPAAYHRTNRHLFYVTDCRFINEANAIRANGGFVVQVHGANESTEVLHVSEQQLPAEVIDFHVLNDVRGDDYLALDTALRGIASVIGISLKSNARSI